MGAGALPIVAVTGALGALSHSESRKARKAGREQANRQEQQLRGAEEKIAGQEKKQMDTIRNRKISEYRGIGKQGMFTRLNRSQIEGTGDRTNLG